MEKIFVIAPRQTGKTDKTIYEFLKDPEHTIFVCYNEKNAKAVFNRIGQKYENNIVTFHNLADKLIGRDIKKIIIDEYLYFNENEKENIYILLNRSYCDLYIFSTADKKYNKKLYLSIKEAKQNNNELANDIKQIFNKQYEII